MTRYEEYLRDHRQNVQYAMDWIINHIDFHALSYLPKIDNLRQILEMQAKCHDESKYTALEYPFYENYFYGDNPADPQVVEAFEQAWLHHIRQNPHHWQHWVLIHDEPAEDGAPDITPLEMPPPMWWKWWRTGGASAGRMITSLKFSPGTRGIEIR